MSPRDRGNAGTKRYSTKPNGAGTVVLRKAQLPGESRNVVAAPSGSLEMTAQVGNGEVSSPLGGTAPMRKDHLNFTNTLNCKASENTTNLINAIATVQQQQ